MRFHDVIWPNKYLLKSVGLWPMHSDADLSTRIFAYVRTVLGICCVTGLLVPLVMTVAVNWGDIKVLGDYGALIVPYFMLDLKMLYLALNRQSFTSVYLQIKDFQNASVDAKEREEYKRLVNFGKFMTFLCLMSGIADIFCFDAIALTYLLINRHQESNVSLRYRPLPMELYYGFDTQSTPAYELMFIWQTICMVFIICAVIGCDCTVMVFVVHVSTRFRLLGMRFTSVGGKTNERNCDVRELCAEFGKCVAQHQHAISLSMCRKNCKLNEFDERATHSVAKEMNALLSPMVFGQIMSSGLEICLSVYAVIQQESNALEVFKFVVLFVSLMCQLACWCVPSEFLIQESNSIADTIYFEVPWYKLSSSQQRDLSFVVMRAQKDCHVSALYKVMCVMRLTEVFNAAGSYMALLRSMKK